MFILGQLIRFLFGTSILLLGAVIAFGAALEDELSTGALLFGISGAILTLVGGLMIAQSVIAIRKNVDQGSLLDPESDRPDGHLQAESEEPEGSDRKYAMQAVGWTLFLLIWLVGGYIIDGRVGGRWAASSGDPVPSHFPLIVYNQTRGGLDVIDYSGLDTYLARANEQGMRISFLMPEGATEQFAFEDTDTWFSYKKIANGGQRVTFGYQMGFMNHPTSTWNATRDGVEPVSATMGSGAYLMSFFLAVGIFVAWGILRLARSIIRSIRAPAD